MQPTEHLWPFVDEPLVNRYFETIEDLDKAVGERCLALMQQTETISASTLFHWWPRLHTSVAMTAQTLASYEAVLIVTDHDDVDYGLVAKHARLVLDTRNACGRASLRAPNIVKV